MDIDEDMINKYDCILTYIDTYAYYRGYGKGISIM